MPTELEDGVKPAETDKAEERVKPEIKTDAPEAPTTPDVKVEEEEAQTVFTPEMSIEDIDKNLDALRTGAKEVKAEPAKPEEKKADVILVNEEYINSQPEEVREYLLSLKGKKADPDVIKIHVNAQKLIAESKKQIQESIKKEEPPANVQEIQSQIEPIKEIYLKENLTAKYKIPEEVYNDPEARAEWEADLNYRNPRQFQQYLKDIDNLTGQVETWAKTVVEEQTNWKGRFSEQVKQEVKEFEEVLKPYGLTAKDLGIELTDEKMQGYFVRDGKANTDVVGYNANKIPVLLPGKLKSLLLETHLPNIIKTTAERNGKQPAKVLQPPSMAGASIIGEERKTEALKEPSFEMSLEDIDKINALAREKVLHGG